MKFIALLRGINVSGRNTIPMDDLRSLCGKLRWGDVQTYIQSGNVVFSADGTSASLEAQLERAIERRFGFPIPVIVRSSVDWPIYLKGNPFPEESKTGPNHVMLVLSKAPPKSDAATTLQARAVDGERVRQVGGAVWIHFADGMARSKLSPVLLDRLIGSTATARNCRTAITLNEMANGASQ